MRGRWHGGALARAKETNPGEVACPTRLTITRGT
jgi:hypothetical protein